MWNKDTYADEIINLFFESENHQINENSLKSFIIKDLKNIGVDIINIKFKIFIYGIEKKNIKINCFDKHSYNILFKNTRIQLLRMNKLKSLNDE